jgi:hypothetical protein
MGLSIGHSLYWFIFVLIVLGMRGIAAILSSEWTSNNRFRISLGNPQPWPIDCETLSYLIRSYLFFSLDTPGLNQDGLRIARMFKSSIHKYRILIYVYRSFGFITGIDGYLHLLNNYHW